MDTGDGTCGTRKVSLPSVSAPRVASGRYLDRGVQRARVRPLALTALLAAPPALPTLRLLPGSHPWPSLPPRSSFTTLLPTLPRRSRPWRMARCRATAATTAAAAAAASTPCRATSRYRWTDAGSRCEYRAATSRASTSPSPPSPLLDDPRARGPSTGTLALAYPTLPFYVFCTGSAAAATAAAAAAAAAPTSCECAASTTRAAASAPAFASTPPNQPRPSARAPRRSRLSPAADSTSPPPLSLRTHARPCAPAPTMLRRPSLTRPACAGTSASTAAAAAAAAAAASRFRSPLRTARCGACSEYRAPRCLTHLVAPAPHPHAPATGTFALANRGPDVAGASRVGIFNPRADYFKIGKGATRGGALGRPSRE